MRPLLTAAALSGALLAVTAADAAACSCAQVDDRTKLRQADAAFVGTLVRVTPLATTGQSSGAGARFRFRIVTRYKGLKGQRHVTVDSNLSSASCGLPGTKGRRYALYLDRQRKRWSSGLCQQTTAARMKAAARARGDASAAAAPACAGSA